MAGGEIGDGRVSGRLVVGEWRCEKWLYANVLPSQSVPNSKLSVPLLPLLIPTGAMATATAYIVRNLFYHLSFWHRSAAHDGILALIFCSAASAIAVATHPTLTLPKPKSDTKAVLSLRPSSPSAYVFISGVALNDNSPLPLHNESN